MAACRVPSTLCPKKWTTQLMVITLSKPTRFSKLFHHRKEEQIVNKTHTRYPTTLKVCWRTTCRKSKLKFAARCAPDGSSVELLWCHLCPSGGEDQRQLLTSYHHQLGGPHFGKLCSFVDEIKLNYSLANTILQYVHVAISGCVQCTVSVKMSLSELL